MLMGRGKRSVTIAIPKKFRNRFQFVRFDQLHRNQSIASCGLNPTCSLNFSESMKMKFLKSIILKTHPMVSLYKFNLIIVEEIANLKKEADALKAIKAAIGTPEFASLVFEKVFNTDIQRLLSMSDMWKSRTPPTPLKFGDYFVPSDEQIAKTAIDDQRVWDLPANIAVFKHRYVQLQIMLTIASIV